MSRHLFCARRLDRQGDRLGGGGTRRLVFPRLGIPLSRSGIVKTTSRKYGTLMFSYTNHEHEVVCSMEIGNYIASTKRQAWTFIILNMR